MSHIYKNASGREIKHVSYSALSDYSYCRRLFYLSRIAGYKDKDKRAAFEFGKCVEDAVQYFHANGMKPGDSVEEVMRLWLKWAEIPLIYTAQEANWKTLFVMGKEMLALYEVLLPSLPLRNPKFQLNYAKPLWPGSDLAELEFTSFVDMLPTAEDGSRILVDIKTAKNELNLTANLLAMDPQLKDYAWATGIRDVAFLWFVKAANPNEFKKGSSVTLLVDTLRGKAGEVREVVKVFEPIGDASIQLMVGEPPTVQLMDAALAEIKGKGSTEAKEKIVQEYLKDGKLDVVSRASVTKVKLQFIRATISEEDLPDVGQDIGNKIFQIRQSAETNFWPKDGGVRFPNQKCSFCRMRGLCLHQPELVDQLLVRIGPNAPEKDWLSDLEEETE